MPIRKRPRRSEDEPAAGAPDPLLVVKGYHQRTKHHPQRFAASLGYLDWDSQPDPFRRFDGAELFALPLEVGGDEPTWDALLTPDAVPPRTVDPEALSRFLFHGMALSAQKRFGASRWSLRVNPSSGNLHPTEAWLLLPASAGLTDDPALFHYAPERHGLEQRARYAGDAWQRLGLPEGGFAVGLSSIAWRESWKYGERAWRYCQHDLGHALGALRFAAALLGWHARLAVNIDDGALAALLGLDRPEATDPDEPESGCALVVVHPPGVEHDAHRVWSTAVCHELARGARWAGRANRLSSDHVAWDIIPVVEAATRLALDGARPWITAPPGAGELPATHAAPDRGVAASGLIRGRRSAVAMDGTTRMPRDALSRLLSATLPRPDRLPWDAQSWPTCVHLVLFVHRVDDLEPGLYVLLRDPGARERLAAASASRHEWRVPDGIGSDLPLFRLAAGDLRATAANASCGQDIAGDGAFSLGMLADFARPLATHGAPFYRHLFWETGLLGQLLYLEAEAAGLRSTGIGCFFDDVVHSLLGLTDDSFQSLYHFTVGGAVDDTRLTTEDPYPRP